MLFAFSVAPTTSDSDDGSVSRAVAEAVRVVRESGLPHETTAMFTTTQADWNVVMPVINGACEAVARFDPRVGLVLKADLRPGFEGQLSAKVDRVEEHLRSDEG